ncbi:MAG: hypothetical protein WCI91_01505 [Candidatus Nomurabacteria bacterium]
MEKFNQEINNIQIDNNIEPNKDNEKLIRELLEFEIFGTKIDVEKHNITFDDNFITETGGVEGYERYKISWAELSKFDSRINSKESYLEALKSKEISLQKKIFGLMEKINLKKMNENNSLTHVFNGFDRFSTNNSALFVKEGILKQKIFDPTFNLKSKPKKSHLGYNFALYNNKTKEPIDLEKMIPGYSRYSDTDIFHHNNIFNGQNFNELIETNEKESNDLNKIFNDITKNSDIFFMGNTERGINGISVDNGTFYGSGNDYTRNKFYFNLNNKGLVKYLSDSKNLLNKYILDKKISKQDIKSVGSPYGGFGKDDMSSYIIQTENNLNNWLEKENWVDFNESKFPTVSRHPYLPVIQSPQSVPLRWCHADMAFLISKNGINFIQMKSIEDASK